MANQIDSALLKQLNDRGATVYDIKGNIDLDASMKKVKEIRTGVSKPESFGLEKDTTILRPGPTRQLANLPRGEKVTFSQDPFQQKLSQVAMAKEAIQRQVSYSPAPIQPPKIDKSKAFKGVLAAGKILTAPNLVTGAIQELIKKPAVAKAVGKFAADVARAPTRAITSVALEPSAQAVSLATGKKVEPIFTPKTKFEKMLLGDEPIKGIFKRTEDSQRFVEKTLIKAGVNPEFAKGNSLLLAPIFVAGMTGLDLTPFGGEKNTAKLVAKSKDADEIFNLIKPIFKESPEDVIKTYANDLVEITNPTAVKDFIAKKIAKKTLPGLENIEISRGVKEEKFVGANEFINRFAKDNPDFASNPVLTMKDGKMVFQSGKDTTKIKPEILGFENLKEGEQIKFTPSKTLKGDVAFERIEPAAKAPQTIEEAIKDKPIQNVINSAGKLDEEKQRKFITTVLDSNKTSPDLKEAVAKMPDKTYDPITNKATFDEAKQFVETDYQGAVNYFNTTKQVDAKYNAVGQTLAKKAADEGRYDDAITIITDLSKAGTEKGQFIQAFSVWDKMTPDGMLYFAQKEINKFNETKGTVRKLVEKVSGKSPKKVEEVVTAVTTKLKEINKQEVENIVNAPSINSLVNQVLQSAKVTAPKIIEETALIQPSLFKNLDLNKIIAESKNSLELSKKIADYLKTSPAKIKTREQEMVETLFRLAKEMLPEREIVKKVKNESQIFADALRHRKDYAKVWDRAEELLSQKYKDAPEELAKLQSTFAHIIGRPFGKKDVISAVTKTLKEEGVLIKDLIRQHYSGLQKAKATLIQDIVSKTGYKEADIKILIDEVAKEFNTRTSEAKRKALESMFKDRKIVESKTKKSLIDQMIEMSNLGAFDETKYLSKISEKLGIKENFLDEETAKFITEKMKSLAGVTDEKVKADIIKEVFEKINDKIPIGFSEIFDAYRYQNMLSSPRTQLRNIYFNLLQTFITRPAQMAVEVPIDWTQAALKGAERERYLKDVPIYYKNVLNSVGDGIEAFKEVWSGHPNIDLINPDFNKFRMDKLPKGVTVVSRFMEGMDQFFRAIIGAGEKAIQMSHGATEEKATEEALRISKYSLLKGGISKEEKEAQGYLLKAIDDFTHWIQQGMNTKVGKYTGMGWFVPFVNTPMRFAKQWIEFSPLGLATLPGNIRKKEQIAKTIMGSMVTLWGAKLAMDGKTTWSVPKNETDKKLFYASGRKPYSVKIGDAWVPMIFFGPTALALAIPAMYQYRFKDSPEALKDSFLEKTIKMIGSGAELFSQQTFMQGLGKYIDLISGNADYKLPSAVAFTLGQAIPFQGLDRWITSIVDPTYRQASGFKESFQKDIPFISKKLPPIESIGGEVSIRDWWNYFTPFDIGKNVQDYDELMKKRMEASQIKSLMSEQEKLIDGELSDISRQFKLMTPEARKKTIKEIYQRGGAGMIRDLIGKLKQSKKIDDLEMDFYKSLEIKSGLRSIFIYQEMSDIGDDKEEKRLFLTNLIKNKILTTEVMKQLIEIKKQEKSSGSTTPLKIFE